MKSRHVYNPANTPVQNKKDIPSAPEANNIFKAQAQKLAESQMQESKQTKKP